MEECKVGEYGRTNLGRIFIFAWLEYAEGKIDESKVLLGDGKTFENRFYYFKEGEKIVKHSRNPIDLIEVGDYVNGKKVLEKVANKFLTVSSSNIGDNRILGFMIKSIVTKEQFSSVEYRLEE